MQELIFQRSRHLLLRIGIFFKFSNMRQQQDKLITILHGFTERIIQQRRQELLLEINDIHDDNNMNTEMGIKRKYALIDVLLKSNVNGKLLTDSDIREEVDTFMFEVNQKAYISIIIINQTLFICKLNIFRVMIQQEQEHFLLCSILRVIQKFRRNALMRFLMCLAMIRMHQQH